MSEVSYWRPIATAPKDCETILVIHRDDLYPVVAFCVTDHEGAEEWMRETEGPEDNYERRENIRHTPLYRSPTHWMPLPEPPRA